ncbi:DUF2059 domain-containing protein [Rhizomicrobium electricum]|uniref:DUF2059 domain-containing protein n=1 Tax=Rhizomicrobium electricum TaxID=480070 RepID=A0ABN1FB23_9PROT|nr:DUF2059 domain-containing protein [Rhizomicrobium electricum]NIJ50711.1 hypothetical protein [Rhizomicrobium electricum]
MKKLLAAFALSVALAAPAFADDAIPAAKLAAAKELIQVSGAEQLFGSVDGLTEAMVAQVKKSAPAIDDDAINHLKAIVKEEFTKAVPGMIEETTKLYARHFSESEMRDMIAFYASPTGKRVVSEMPALMRESMQMSVQTSNVIIQRFIAYMQERAAKEAPKQ